MKVADDFAQRERRARPWLPAATTEGPSFDGDRFLRLQADALTLALHIRPWLRTRLDRGVERIFVLGAGGAQLLALPALDLLRRRGRFPVAAGHPAEIVLAPPAGLDRNALALLPSLSGPGPEDEGVGLPAFLEARGVAMLTLTGHGGLPAAAGGPDDPAGMPGRPEALYLQMLIVALALLAETGAIDDFDAMTAELARLPPLLAAARLAYEPEAARLAEAIRDEPYHIVTGAGSAWPEAHRFGMCVLEGGLRIRARPVHAADFFHGTLELVEPGVSILILKGEDASRPLADRVDRFVRRYTDKVWVIDAATAALPGLSPHLRALVSPVILAALLERLGAHLARPAPSPPARSTTERVED